MTTNKEASELVGKILVGIAVNFVLSPLLLICGGNFVLEGLGLGSIPYTLGTYFGALLLLLATRIRVVD